MRTPLRGEVYMVDLGLAAKVRPCVVLSVPLEQSDRSLVTVIAHTSALRQARFEIVVLSRFLRPGAFDVQGIVRHRHRSHSSTDEPTRDAHH